MKRGVWGPGYEASSRNDARRLTSWSNGMPSKKIMESLRTFVFVETVLRRGRLFQGSDEVRILYFIMLNKKIRSAWLVYTPPWTWKFFAASSTTMELLPLKDWTTQEWVWLKFVLLVWGVTCGSLVIEVQYLELYFLRFSWTWLKLSCSTHNFYINRILISYSMI